ncbi:MAG: fold metallo-hydrolase [Gemmatimonadetes bacterium]|nr:fold metallo-hydrolase [Gemmatimonadota bacterium]
MEIRRSEERDATAILTIINDAAVAYCGVIPAGRWHEPYMSADELQRKITAGIAFWAAASWAIDFYRRMATLRSLVGIAILVPSLALAQASRTQIVMLGTGTPIPDPDRTGPAVAIVVDTVAYLFDAGTGVVRRASAAGRNGIKAFAPRAPSLQSQYSPRFDRVFLTHLHSDHTLGLADVIFTPWIQGRRVPLDIYGPPGTNRLVTGILDGNAEDIAERTVASGGPSPEGWKSVVHEISEGPVFQDSRVTVTAFAVPHAGWKYAFGYRVQTPDRLIVISGDERANPSIAAQCRGCDVLIHEVYSAAGFATLPALRQVYHAQAHTSATQLGDIATQAKPKLLILYHQLFFGSTDDVLLGEVRSRFSGRVVSAKDLDVY